MNKEKFRRLRRNYLVDKETYIFRVIELAFPSGVVFFILSNESLLLGSIGVFIGIAFISLFRWVDIIRRRRKP